LVTSLAFQEGETDYSESYTHTARLRFQMYPILLQQSRYSPLSKVHFDSRGSLVLMTEEEGKYILDDDLIPCKVPMNTKHRGYTLEVLENTFPYMEEELKKRALIDQLDSTCLQLSSQDCQKAREQKCIYHQIYKFQLTLLKLTF